MTFGGAEENITEEPENNYQLKKMLDKNYKFKKISKIPCLQIANYFLNYGTNFKYYHPITNQKGIFMGEILHGNQNFIQKAEKIRNIFVLVNDL